jgi:hypothetical protein
MGFDRPDLLEQERWNKIRSYLFNERFYLHPEHKRADNLLRKLTTGVRGGRESTLGIYTPEEVWKLVDGKQSYVMVKGWRVHVHSRRLKMFRNQTSCIMCGREGVGFKLARRELDSSKTAYFAFFGKKGKKQVLMTIDHWVPLSKGGSDRNHNRRVMCRDCNGKKSDTMPDQLIIPS